MDTFPLDDLAYLESLKRNGSVAAVGRELGVAPSTVYRRIEALEARLGVACFARGEGLNPVGLELAAVAEDAQFKLGALIRKARAEHTEVDGSVTLTTVTGFAPVLAGVLADLSERHPALHLELHVSDRAGLSVRDRQADIALSLVPRPPPQLVGKKVMHVRYGVFAHARLQHQAKTAPWVALSRPMHDTPQARWEQKHLKHKPIAISTGSRLAFVEFVRRGVGLGVLPKALAARYPELILLPNHARSLSKLRLPVWLLTHPELHRSPRVAAVMDAISDALKPHR